MDIVVGVCLGIVALVVLCFLVGGIEISGNSTTTERRKPYQYPEPKGWSVTTTETQPEPASCRVTTSKHRYDDTVGTWLRTLGVVASDDTWIGAALLYRTYAVFCSDRLLTPCAPNKFRGQILPALGCKEKVTNKGKLYGVRIRNLDSLTLPTALGAKS